MVIFVQPLEKLGLLFISTSGHTGREKPDNNTESIFL